MNSVSATSSRFPSFQQWSPIGALVGGIFIIDLLIPLGVAAAVLYIAAILMSLRHRKSQLSLGTAIACSTLTIIALFLSPVGGELWKVLMNRVLSLFAIWTTALMVRYQLQQTEFIETREKTIQDFIDTMPSACFSFDQQGTILSWNPAAEHIYGYSKKEAVGVSCFELMVTPETREDSKNVIAGIFQGKSFQDMIWHDQNKNGEYGWRAGNLFPVFDPQGHVAYGVNFNVDITAQKTAEFELQTNNVLLTAILESATDAIYAKDYEGKHLLFNRAAGEIVGKPSERIIGLDDTEVFGQEVAECLGQFDREVCSQGKTLCIEEKIVTQERLRVYSTKKSPLKDSAGKIIGLVGISRDITEQKLAQQDLLLTDRVFMASPDHISILGSDYRYRRVNPSYEEAFGKNGQPLVGLSVSDLLEEQTFIQTVKPMLDRCFQGEEIHYESWFTFPNEQRHYMNVSYLPLSQENTDVQEIVVISRDLTEHQKAKEALHAHERQTRAILDSMQALIGIGSIDGTVLDINKFSLDVADLRRADIVGKHLTETYWVAYSDDTQQQIHRMLKQVAKDQTVREDVVIRVGEHTYLTVDTCFVPVHDENGAAVQLVGSAIDVTERRKAELALQHSEEQFRDLYETAPLAFFSATLDGNLIRANTAAHILLGYSLEELMGKHVLALYAPTPNGREKAERLQNQAQAGTPIHGEELEMLRKDGQYVWVSLSLLLIYDKKGQIIERRGIAQDISSRKRMEHELRASEHRFRSLVDTAGSIIIGLTPDGWIVEWNREAERLFGKTRAKALDTNYFESFIQGNDRLHFMTDIKRVMTGKPFRDLHHSVAGRTGEKLQILWNMDPLFNEKEQPYGVICVGRDITEWEKAQTQLQKWATIYQHTQWGVAVSRGESSVLEMVNEAYACMHGYAIRELEGMPISQVFSPEFRSQLPRIIEQIHDEGSLSFEAVHLRKDGSTFSALVTVSSIKDLNGQTLYRVANVIDISDHKNAEEAFRQSERLAHSAMNALTAQLCVLDETGQILTTNERWDQFGRENNGDPKKLGKGSNYITVCVQSAKNDGKDAKTFLNGLNAVLTRQQEEFSFDYPCSSPEKIRWFSARVTRFPDPGPIRVVVSHYDITERKILEAAIRKQTVNLEAEVIRRTNRIQELEQRRMQVEKLAALAQIAAGVAHEINNPLASISQSLVLLKRAIPQEHPHFRYMAKVEDCIDRIAQITKHLYQLYRPSGPIPTPIDLRVPLHTAKDIMAERAQKHGIRIRTSSTPDPITASVPQGELTQVLCNLIQNAIEASPPDSTIDVSIATGAEVLSILVADQGRGIPPEAASHIFEPFYTTKQNHEEGGMGLGLSISHSLIESMGGKLDFSTSIGQGSTFTIKLPPT